MKTKLGGPAPLIENVVVPVILFGVWSHVLILACCSGILFYELCVNGMLCERHTIFLTIIALMAIVVIFLLYSSARMQDLNEKSMMFILCFLITAFMANAGPFFWLTADFILTSAGFTKLFDGGCEALTDISEKVHCTWLEAELGLSNRQWQWFALMALAGLGMFVIIIIMASFIAQMWMLWLVRKQAIAFDNHEEDPRANDPKWLQVLIAQQIEQKANQRKLKIELSEKRREASRLKRESRNARPHSFLTA